MLGSQILGLFLVIYLAQLNLIHIVLHEMFCWCNSSICSWSRCRMYKWPHWPDSFSRGYCCHLRLPHPVPHHCSVQKNSHCHSHHWTNQQVSLKFSCPISPLRSFPVDFLHFQSSSTHDVCSSVAHRSFCFPVSNSGIWSGFFPPYVSSFSYDGNSQHLGFLFTIHKLIQFLCPLMHNPWLGWDMCWPLVEETPSILQQHLPTPLAMMELGRSTSKQLCKVSHVKKV